jgi:hypothetical protein
MKEIFKSIAPVTFLCGLAVGINWIGDPIGFLGMGVTIVSGLVSW